MDKQIALLLFLSDYKSEKSSTQYVYGNKVYEGKQTCDAPIRCLFDIARKNGQKVGKILCIVSSKVYFGHEFQGESSFTYFKKCVVEPLDDAAEVVPIPYDFDTFDRDTFKEVKETGKRALQIYSKIATELSGYKWVYFDFTGGFRDFIFLMTSIIKYMEFTGIRCSKIIYSNPYESKTQGAIKDIDFIYEMYQMVSGVNEFVQSGNIDQLERVFSKDCSLEVRNILNILRKFSETIKLCDLSGIGEDMRKLSEGLTAFEAGVSGDIHEEMLKTLIPEIRRRFYMDWATGEELHGTELTYPRLIKWCIENGLLQQAMTIYIEKMPEFYLETCDIPKECLKIDSKERMLSGQSESTYIFYTKFFDYFSKKGLFEEWLQDLSEINAIVGRPFNREENEKNWRDRISSKMKEINDLANRAENLEKMEKMWERLYAVLDVYQQNSKHPSVERMKACDKTWPRNFSAFVNKLIGRDPLYREYIENNDVSAAVGEQKEKKIKNTYRVKMENILCMETSELEEIEKQRYRRIMQDYLAVKLIRNRVNHAASSEENEDISDVEKFLMDRGFQFSYDFQGVRNLMEQVVEGWI